MARLAETLEELRRRSFVGRDEEIALFRRALAGPGVIFVHGAGGVGKTTLLDMFAHLAAEAGRTPVRVDARHLTLGSQTLPAPPGDGRPVLLIDTYELLEPVDDWVREQYLPSLPADCLVVIAGRRAPQPGWRADPAWRALTRVVVLDNLPAGDSRAYLDAQDVPAAVHDHLLAISRGHPLTLSLLTDAVARGATPRSLRDVPDVVGALVARLITQAPSLRHRAALEACAQVPATTVGYLRAVVGGDADELFAWLRGQPFIGESPHGLYPHDVVRAVLDADLRWRDPERYAEMYRRKLTAFHDQVRALSDEREQLELVIRMVILNGARSSLGPLAALPPPLRAYADRLRESDREPILAMTTRWQGTEQAELVATWMHRRPEAFRAFRTAEGELRGYTACLDLTEADLGLDPGADAMWQYASKHAPPRPGERIRAWRFFLDRDHGQGPSASTTLFLACQVRDILLLGDDIAWTLVGAWQDAELWGPFMELIDFWAATDADYRIGVSRFPVFAHDWRRIGVEELTQVMHARHVGTPVRPAGAGAGAPVLSRSDFTDAVRSALRHLHTPELLDENPLLRSRMIRRHARAGLTPAEALRELLEAGAGALEADLGELVIRTFLRPATTQERVAATLHLSFNTYRRHRDKAITQLATWLWEHETGQRPGRPHPH
jgi:hypothetical protein